MLDLPILHVRLAACSADWQQMTPTAQGRHCAACQREVIDFTNGNAADLKAAQAAAPDGRVCGRFRVAQLAPPPRLRPKLRRFLVALVLLCGLGLSRQQAWAQVRKAGQSAAVTDKKTQDFAFGGVEVMPVYKDGGQEGIMRFIAKNLHYPTDLTEEGRVFISFTIDTTGTVRNSRIARGFSPDADKEALRVVKMLGDFTPGTQNGRPVEVQYTVPISFKPN